ncbi:nicotinamide riboside transporter PnuC [Leeuwenhoekiella nanhaiensis]|uniref:Nicotinamide riboside transporter PnuC n=1 Tax=Leeuwenhoekiella nanhaiensis TaxID=1655491 RepID=A0A2G1VNS9_9FLAO|nr:nicotinamide riboside transporter PnuC [Leeuwenhoekiella nanhaiensis]PHQ28425.1 hypothetical protein CJ305_15040 [Leeuwenhoekiella nanhaiensis]
MEDFLMSFVWLQWIGTAFGITQVLLARQNNVNNYIFGIIAILISIWVLYHSKLYADIILHLYYFVMSVYGWLYWKFGKKQEEAPISYSSRKEHLQALGIVAGCFILMVFWLTHYTNSDVPYWDSVVSAFAWAGMWLMARRKIENWIYLNISNIVSIPLLIYKELYIYAGLTGFLFCVAISGYLKWRKLIKNEQHEQLAHT